MIKISMAKTETHSKKALLNLEHLDFDIVSDFDILVFYNGCNLLMIS
jgi:hypothetical protein